jgi:hypothetical protein
MVIGLSDRRLALLPTLIASIARFPIGELDHGFPGADNLVAIVAHLNVERDPAALMRRQHLDDTRTV